MKTYYFLSILLLLTLLFVQCSKEDADTLPTDKAYTDGFASTSTAPSAPAPGPGNGNGSKPGVITAGEWNDIDNWDFWNNLMNKQEAAELSQKWQFALQHKYAILLKDNSGKIITDAKVSLETQEGKLLAEGRTDNSGRCDLFTTADKKTGDIQLKVVYANEVFYMGNVDAQQKTIEKQLNVSRYVSNKLDIVFVVDATGSMGDEMSYLQTELKDVINRVKQQATNNLTIRLGSVFYRDQGDDYVTKSFPLSSNINSLLTHINEQAAGGGGDFPEAVDEALSEAIGGQNWSNEAISRIVFLVLDAPPHYNPTVVDKLTRITAEAAKKGIKIIPVTASGIDKETEYLMRSLAIRTNGTYVFITDHSGIGNDHLEPTVGKYEVEFLNDLMVRLILKYSEVK